MLRVKTKLAPSKIHGLGIFADEFVPRGAIVWALDPSFDIAFAPDDLADLPPFVQEKVMRYSYLSKETGKGILCADDGRFMNHSSQSNTESRTDEQGYETTVASRDIAVGEEITCNYYEFDADAARKLGTHPR